MPSRPLIKFTGTIASHPATFLLDCGATGDFVSTAFVRRHPELSLSRKQRLIETVTLADGSQQPSTGLLSTTPVRIGTYREPMTFLATELSGYDAILGMPWLHRLNPNIDWQAQLIIFVDEFNHRHVLCGSSGSCVPIGPCARAASASAGGRAAPADPPFESSNGRSDDHARRPPTATLNMVSAKTMQAYHLAGAIEYGCWVWPQSLLHRPLPCRPPCRCPLSAAVLADGTAGGQHHEHTTDSHTTFRAVVP